MSINSQQHPPPHHRSITLWWNQFFHSRTNIKSSTNVFTLCGRLRMMYALLILFDRYILSYDFNEFYLTPMMPCFQHYQPTKIFPISHYSIMCTIVGMVHSPTQVPYVYYIFFYIGVLNATLLLFGVAPKLQLLLLHVNMLSFHHHSYSILDGEDTMFTIWNFLFLFLPLHHVTIFDGFRHLFYHKQNEMVETVKSEAGSTSSTKQTNAATNNMETWPMWPFRLWQIEICCIYMGAGYSKLSTDMWYSGNALYRIIHTNDFFGGPITPDFLFNRRGPLHLLTWSSLVVECSCIILIWPLYTRKAMLVAIILLHLGIEGAMNMHCFEWLTMIGWLFFLVERQDDAKENDHIPKLTSTSAAGADDTNDNTKPQPKTITSSDSAKTSGTVVKSHWTRRMLIDLFLLIAIPTFVFDTIPFNELTRFIPSNVDGKTASMSPLLEQLELALLALNNFRTNVAQPYYYIPFVHPIGLYQGVWDLFTGSQDHNHRIETIIHYRNDTFYTHISPDWINMTWYVKKRWQRVMTFYENFMDLACMDCYARYYAEQHGPKDAVRSVRLMLHSEQPPIEPPGNIFDMEYFFKPAKEALVSNTPKEIFLLNYCDDTEDECEEYMEMGHCSSNSGESDSVLLQMTKSCRQSCQLCDVDEDALEIGARVSVFYYMDEEYMDGTIIDLKTLHAVRQYLIRYDGYENEPEWTTSTALRRLGVRLLPNDSKVGDMSDDSGYVEASETTSDLSGDEL